MKWTSLVLVFVAYLSVCTGLPRILVAQEAQENVVLKHISEWADVKYIPVADVIMNGDAEAIIVDGILYSKYLEGLHATLLHRAVPIIVMNMTADQKDVMIEQMTFGTQGASYIYSILPFADRNQLRHHRIIDVPARKIEYSKKAKIEDTNQSADFESVTFETNFEQSAKMFSDELLACVVKGVFNPPTNMTPPAGALYAILPFTILGTYNVNLNDMNKPGTQTVSHRLDNNFYNYRENGFGEDAYYSVLMQDGIVSPGTLIVNNPTQAIGFYQFMFTVANQPFPNGNLPSGNTFYWAQSSPATVDQTISVTNQVSESLSLEVDMTVNGPSNQISVSWTASTSVTSEIEQWGIVEDTNPTNSTTAWTYHQQVPYDPFELNWNNFNDWFAIAYNGKNVKTVPDLSLNTLQVHTISAWYASGSLRNSDGTLPVQTTSSRNHEVAIICTQDYYNGHHHAEWWFNAFSDNFKMDLNSFPNQNQLRKG